MTISDVQAIDLPISAIPQLCLANRYLGKSNTLHAHDFVEIILVTRGELTMKIGNKLIYGQTDDLFIIPPRSAHLQTEQPTAGVTYIGFRNIPDYFSPKFRKISLAGDFFVHRWMDDIVELRLRAYNRSSIIKIASGLLLSIISKLEQLENSHQDRIALHPMVRKAMQIIESNIAHPFGIENITESIGISESYLNTLFRKYLSKSPLQYQLDLKMELAKSHLVDPHNSVKQVASYCGFQDTNYFIRQFRKKFNITPGKWREEYKNFNLQI